MQIHYALDAPAALARRGARQGGAAAPDAGARRRLARPPTRPSAACCRPMPTICVGQPTALDPSRAPAGQAVLWLQLPEAPRVIKGDAAGHDRGARRTGAGPRRSAKPMPTGSRRSWRATSTGFAESVLARTSLFAGRPRGHERQSRRRRPLWRVLRPRPVLPVAALQGHGEPPHAGAGPLPHRRRDPSRARASAAARAFCSPSRCR